MPLTNMETAPSGICGLHGFLGSLGSLYPLYVCCGLLIAELRLLLIPHIAYEDVQQPLLLKHLLRVRVLLFRFWARQHKRKTLSRQDVVLRQLEIVVEPYIPDPQAHQRARNFLLDAEFAL